MTGQQWRLARRILAILEAEIGLTDDALARRLNVRSSDLRPVLGALYGQKKVDFCVGYVVLPRYGEGGERGMNIPVDAKTLAVAVDLIGGQAERERKAERRGHERGRRQGHADGYEVGYLQAVADIKAVEHDLARDIPAAFELDLVRWPPAGRAAFGRPREGDYPGGSLPLEHPNELWLGGAPVHRPQGYTAACRSYRPGWYSPIEAIKILSRLPHDYAEVIGELRAKAKAVAA